MHKSADIQAKFPVKIQSGSATRAWRSLFDRYLSVSKCYPHLEHVIRKRPRYFLVINKEHFDSVSSFLQQFKFYFDNLETVKTPSAHQVIIFRKFKNIKLGNMYRLYIIIKIKDI